MQCFSISKVAACYTEAKIRKVDNRINLIQKQELLMTTNANPKSYGENCSSNIDYRIEGIPHSTVQQQDTNRREVD